MTRQYSDRAPAPLIQPQIVSINFPKYQARPCLLHSSKKLLREGVYSMSRCLLSMRLMYSFQTDPRSARFRSADQQQFSNFGPFDQIHMES